MITGLREGFWPLDEGDWKIEKDERPENYPLEEVDLNSIREFKIREQLAGRWSEEVSDALPGTKILPPFVAWRDNKPRVIKDHSGSGLNDGIRREDAKVLYDDMRSFGQSMLHAVKMHHSRKLTTFKSDVAKAFLNLPAHPLWQIRQLVRVDGKLYIIRRLVFGNRASPRIWCAVSSLICWIAVRKLDIVGLHVFMDNFFGWDFDDDMVFFRGVSRPRKQVQLLILWEAIGCPFDDAKQLAGSPLKIIGFWVDINLGSISLELHTVTDITEAILVFLQQKDRKPTLRHWQRLLGHLNWLLNVLPWARPALTEAYRKIVNLTVTVGFISTAKSEMTLCGLWKLSPKQSASTSSTMANGMTTRLTW